ncbi:Heat shock 70 kDa protein 12A [Mactra antiquata]
MISTDTPTVILFDEHKKFHSFGYKAEEAYSELALNNEHHKWYFFKRFKMILHENKIKIEDVKEKKMLASEVFRGAIEYLKDNVLDCLTEGIVLQNSDIHWVLTIPAIWTVSAKQVMREAANKAGIYVTQLSIVLESEAAISFCQMIPRDKIKGSDVAKFDIASPGTKFMVISLEDNTSDTTVYERRDDGGLRELHTANGGAWGGTKVKEEFFSMIIELVGGPIFTKFINENWEEYLDMQNQLEIKIHMVTPKTSGKMSITIPHALLQTFESKSGEKVMEAIDGSPYARKIIWKGEKMRIDAQVFKNLFKPCTDKIVKNIKNLLKYPDVQGTNIFYMVGKFSESEMIQDAITTALPRKNVIIPDAPRLAVLKGAVIFGHRPIAITSRKSKYTYGINISPPFDPTIHPEDHRVSVDGNDRCRDVFKKYILEGETVRVGEAKSGEHVTLNTNQCEMLLNVFACPRQNPLFVDEGDVEYLGNIAVNLPEYADEVRVEVKMILSEAELIVEAEEMSKRTKYRAYFEDL